MADAGSSQTAAHTAPSTVGDERKVAPPTDVEATATPKLQHSHAHSPRVSSPLVRSADGGIESPMSSGGRPVQPASAPPRVVAPEAAIVTPQRRFQAAHPSSLIPPPELSPANDRRDDVSTSPRLSGVEQSELAARALLTSLSQLDGTPEPRHSVDAERAADASSVGGDNSDGSQYNAPMSPFASPTQRKLLAALLNSPGSDAKAHTPSDAPASPASVSPRLEAAVSSMVTAALSQHGISASASPRPSPTLLVPGVSPTSGLQHVTLSPLNTPASPISLGCDDDVNADDSRHGDDEAPLPAVGSLHTPAASTDATDAGVGVPGPAVNVGAGGRPRSYSSMSESQQDLAWRFVRHRFVLRTSTCKLVLPQPDLGITELQVVWAVFQHYASSSGEPTIASTLGVNRFRKCCKDAGVVSVRAVGLLRAAPALADPLLYGPCVSADEVAPPQPQ